MPGRVETRVPGRGETRVPGRGETPGRAIPVNSSSASYPTSRGVDVFDWSTSHRSVLRLLSSYAVSLSRPPWFSPSIVALACPASLYVQSHHSFSHIVLLFSYYLTKSPQPLFLHFPGYFSHFRHPIDYFIYYRMQLCYFTNPSQYYHLRHAQRVLIPANASDPI